MALDPRQSLPSRAAPPGFAFPPQWIEGIDFGLQSGKPVIICGPPMSGKTSLIRHWLRLNPDTQSTVIDISSDQLEVHGLLKNMALNLEVPPESTNVDNLVEVLESSDLLMVIENIDKVAHWAQLLDQLTVSASRLNRSVRLIITVSDLTEANPLTLIDTSVVRLSGLGEPEMSKILVDSNLRIHPGASLTELASALAKLTGGMPYLVRIYIALLHTMEQMVSLELLKGLARNAIQSFLQKVQSSLSSNDLSRLKLASLVVHDVKLRHELLNSLSTSSRAQLLSAGLLSHSLLGQWQLSSEVSSALQAETSSETALLRDQLLMKLNADSAAEIAESAYQLTKLNRLEEAARLFNAKATLLSNELCTRTFVAVSEEFAHLLSHQAFWTRRKYLFERSEFIKLHQEHERRLASSKNKDGDGVEAGSVQLSLAELYFSVNDMDRARKTAEPLIKHFPATTDLHWLAKRTIARTYLFTDPHKSANLLEESMHTLRNTHPDIFNRLYRNYFFSLFWAKENLCRFKDLEGITRQYLDHLNQNESPFEKQRCIHNLAYLHFEIGEVEETRKYFQTLEEETNRFDDHSGKMLLLELKIFTFIDQGNFKSAAELFFNHYFDELSNRFHSAYQQNYWYVKGILLSRLGQPHLFIASLHSKDHASSLGTSLNVQPPFEETSVRNALYDHDFNILEEMSGLYKRSAPLNYVRTLELLIEIQWQDLTKFKWPSITDSVITSLAEIERGSSWHKVMTMTLLLDVVAERPIPLKKLEIVRGYFTEKKLILWQMRVGLIEFLVAPSAPSLQKLTDLRNQISGDCIEAELVDFTLELQSDPNFSQLNHGQPQSSPAFVRMAKALATATISESPIQTTPKMEQQESPDVYELDQNSRVLKTPTSKIILKDKVTLYRILETLFSHPTKWLSKEEITTAVWKESYHPLVHDTRIYTSIRRLREIVPIDTRDGGYRIMGSVKLSR
jgi:tetratricopeptide (TPR) repeat protein